MKYLLIILLSIPFFATAQEKIKPTKDIKGLIAQMGGKNRVYGKFVGFAGSTSDEFLAFEQFVQKAKLGEMKFYLDHKDASIRAYAFWAIVVKHPMMAKSLIKELPEDKAEISTMLGGCMMQMETVSSFRKQILKGSSKGLFPSNKKKNTKYSSPSTDY